MKKTYKIRRARIVITLVVLVVGPLSVLLYAPELPLKDVVFFSLMLLVAVFAILSSMNKHKIIEEGLILGESGLVWKELEDTCGISEIPWSEIDHVKALVRTGPRSCLQVFIKDGAFKESIRWPFLDRLIGKKWIEIPLDLVKGRPRDMVDEIVSRIDSNNPEKYYGVNAEANIGAAIAPFIAGFLGFCYWQDVSPVGDFLGRNTITLISIALISGYIFLQLCRFVAQIAFGKQ